MRTICILAFACATTWAQSPLVKILSDELDRNFTILKQKGEPPPYFMDYSVNDDEADILVASEGSLDMQNHIHHRRLDVSIRAGSPQFDNYRKVGNDRPRFTSGASIALDDNPASIRQFLWLATDSVYRAVSNRLIRLKADEKLRAQLPATPPAIFRRRSRKSPSPSRPNTSSIAPIGPSGSENFRRSSPSIPARSTPACLSNRSAWPPRR